MDSVVVRTEAALTQARETAEFNLDDFMAVLQAAVGFVSSVASKDPFAFIASGIGLAEDLIGKACLGPLEDMLDTLGQWLTFGANFSPLMDSSDLNFDLVDVESVPEVMKVSYDLVPRSLAADSQRHPEGNS